MRNTIGLPSLRNASADSATRSKEGPPPAIGRCSFWMSGGPSKEKTIVGVNAYVEDDEPPMPILYIDDGAANAQLARMADVKARRDPARVAATLAALRECARGTGNTMYPLLDCVRAYATVGEMCNALRDVWGEYEEVPSI